MSVATPKHFHRGLVVGKFSPLHRGHELVIYRALEMCREVVLISYSKPEFPGCEAERREQWLADLFPKAIRLVATEQRLRDWWRLLPAAVDTAGYELHRRMRTFLTGLSPDLRGSLWRQ